MSVCPHLRACRKQDCAFCGSTVRVEQHHLGGQAHAPFFTLPLCKRHHEFVTRALFNSDSTLMLPTSEVEERKRRARAACVVFLWWLDTKEFSTMEVKS